MQANKFKTVRSDVQDLLQQAQDLFAEASEATGKKADELRAKGQDVLNQALNVAQTAQTAVVQGGRELVAGTDEYVQANPWRSIAISAGVGLLVGLAVGRTSDRY